MEDIKEQNDGVAGWLETSSSPLLKYNVANAVSDFSRLHSPTKACCFTFSCLLLALKTFRASGNLSSVIKH